MDPKVAIQNIMRGDRPTEHARAYNAWRRSQGFAVEAFLPEAYDLGRGSSSRLVDIDRIFRGHRSWRVRYERRGGQGFGYINLNELTLAWYP